MLANVLFLDLSPSLFAASPMAVQDTASLAPTISLIGVLNEVDCIHGPKSNISVSYFWVLLQFLFPLLRIEVSFFVYLEILQVQISELFELPIEFELLFIKFHNRIVTTAALSVCWKHGFFYLISGLDILEVTHRHQIVHLSHVPFTEIDVGDLIVKGFHIVWTEFWVD